MGTTALLAGADRVLLYPRSEFRRALNVAATRSTSPSKRNIKALSAPHSLAELSTTVSSTA